MMWDQLSAEYDVDIEKVEYNGFSSVISKPKQAGKHPAIVTIHGLFGLQEMDVRLTAQLAALGYIAMVHGWQTHEHDPADREIMDGIDKAIDYLSTLDNVDSARIGLIGVCRGGSIAMISAANIDRLKAAVAFYGQTYYPIKNSSKPVSPIEMASDVKSPILVIHGEADTIFNVQESIDYCEELASHEKVYEFYSYPGAAHGFFLQGHRNYHREAAEDSWKRLKAFLEKYL